ncbi:hypothetical protein DNTS_003895 [Danionella cerebrum]|uniref:Gelsolin-like domain-containing protein n=1 Tax=Danionella cerebrum TaxID=2873325 RepID=A0A553N2G7_9TELE|nr:hypothetical protein DNTS_003895 [Danionella translucida]
MENVSQESRAERIARYKAERRRELAERYGNQDEELPSKWSRREREGHGVHDSTHVDVSGGINRGIGRNGRVPLEERPAPANQARVLGKVDGENPPDSKAQLLTHVSVGQLKNALLQQSSNAALVSDGDAVAMTLDLAGHPGSEGCRRRTRRYMPGDPNASRKNNERFRTQPITACEIKESCGAMDGETQDSSQMDIKTDDRAQMSVAAKMSLFKELEKTASPESSSLLKPRSSRSFHERRGRRINDPRALTQPITFEESVLAGSPQSSKAVEPEPEDDDAATKLSMSEKLALFNKLSQPNLSMVASPVRDVPPLDAPERRRQKGARYRTQPITVEEKRPVQLPRLQLDPHLSDRQQSESINLRPSEVRLSGLSSSHDSSIHMKSTTDSISQNSLQIKGILKKSSSEGVVWRGEPRERRDLNGYGPEQNSSERILDQLPSSASLSGAPWRQKGRNETPGRIQKSAPKSEECHSLSELQQNTESRLTEPQVTKDAEETQSSETKCNVSQNSDRQEPVFSSIYSNSTPQYVMFFNERSLSYEAQEVSASTEGQQKATWKAKASHENEDILTLTKVVSTSEFQEGQLFDAEMHREVKTSEACPEPVCLTARGDAEPDLGTLCQTSMPILSSAVAEHRRSVRPSRRTQGSRNPLRALAAREDIQQDFMRLEQNSQMEENTAAKTSNCSSADVTASGKVSRPTVPYNKLMLIQVKGWRQVQVRLVEPVSHSLNSGDSFLLVTHTHCFLWTGKLSNTIEREKRKMEREQEGETEEDGERKQRMKENEKEMKMERENERKRVGEKEMKREKQEEGE